ncbi:MAG: glycosyltransferase family 4 protein [Spirochaetales bacterium]|nr:glycosyltransferase family 4 protein [Spirochaetales bacterium]
MKIGLVLDDNALKGGISQYSFSLANALSLLDEHHLVIFTKSGTFFETSLKAEVRRYEGFRRSKGSRLRKFLALLFKRPNNACVTDFDRKAFEGVDLIFCPVSDVYPHFFLGIPFVFTLHDLQEKHLPGFFDGKNRLGRHLENGALLTNCRGVLCESRFVRDDILKFFPKTVAEKIHVLPVPPFQTKDTPADLDLQIPAKFGGKPYLFYPAQFWAHKNHLRLFEALKIVRQEFPQLRLVCTGGHLYEFDRVQQKARDLDLENAVSFPGYVDKETLVQLYRQAEMLVMPTLFESVSIPIYEAFSLGVPVCSSNVTALPEQVGDAGLLFDPYQPKDIAEKILRLMRDPSAGQKLVEKGRERMQGFTLETFSQGLAQVINAVMKGKSA